GPAASAPFPVYIGFPASSTRIASITPNPSLFGQLPIATVQVAAAVGTATGQVVLKQGSTTLGVGNLDSSGSVVFNLPSLPVGSWPITASYAGSPLTQGRASSPITL